MSILISIITVCYNSADTIETTIKNVLGLPYANIDYIIIDGGSTDGTVQIIQKYASKLKYWISEPDKGIYDAMNKGWAVANADSYILYIGSGDKVLHLPDTDIESADVIYGDVELGTAHLYKTKHNFMLKLANTIHHQAELVRKSIHPAPPFKIEYKTYADFNFNQQLMLKKARFVKDPSFRGFALEGGISTQFDKQQALKVIRGNLGYGYYWLAKLYYFYKNGKL